MVNSILHALSALCTSMSRREEVEQQQPAVVVASLARNSVHIMQGSSSSRTSSSPVAARKKSHVYRLLHRRKSEPASPQLLLPPLRRRPSRHRHHHQHSRKHVTGKSDQRRKNSTIKMISPPPRGRSVSFSHNLHYTNKPAEMPAPPLPPAAAAANNSLPRFDELLIPNNNNSSAQSSGTYNEAVVAETLAPLPKNTPSPTSMRTLASDNRRGRGKKLADPAAAFTQTLTVANVALDSLDAKLPVDRCATHPGSRNDLWCGSCSAAICSHCVSAATGAHRTHSVVKLSAAYDDTYEAIEALQLDLVSHLAETRQRNSLLDDAAQRLAEDYEAALAAMDAQMMRDSARVEAARAEAEAELLGLSDACGSWRSVLKDALGAVQRMMEDLAPAQALAERGRMVRMLGLAAQARPGAWDSELPQPQVSAHVTPAWVFAELSVAAVAELGRRRGHVHVMGDPFSAHGAVWQAKVSRSRTALGEPSLALAVACVEGPPAAAKRAYSVSASVASLGVDLAYSGHWAQGSEHVFSLCLLDSVAANDDGSLAVRVGVQPESFRELALAQAARIEELERRVKR
ncbi:hypothetical protein GGI21_004308, partial [Coemansia aciculifera]